jgi:hypothetical protein
MGINNCAAAMSDTNNLPVKDNCGNILTQVLQ